MYVVEASSDELVFVLLTYILCGVVTIPLWLRLSHRVEKHRLVDLAPYLALVACAGSSFGAFSVFKSSMIGDLADADAWRSPTGERREGEIQGLFDLFSRGLSACLVGPALIVLNYSYVPNRHPQTAQAETAIRVAYGLVPALMGFAAVLCMLRYDLTRERHERLRHSRVPCLSRPSYCRQLVTATDESRQRRRGTCIDLTTRRRGSQIAHNTTSGTSRRPPCSRSAISGRWQEDRNSPRHFSDVGMGASCVQVANGLLCLRLRRCRA